jgi:hypothetical protein
MNIEPKKSNINVRVSMSLKEQIVKRANELKKSESEYIIALIIRDLSSSDIIETDKPRLREFSKIIASEITNELFHKIEIESVKNKDRQDKLLAQSLYSYKELLYYLISILVRLKNVQKQSQESLINLENEIRKDLNGKVSRHVEIIASKSVDEILELINKTLPLLNN